LGALGLLENHQVPDKILGFKTTDNLNVAFLAAVATYMHSNSTSNPTLQADGRIQRMGGVHKKTPSESRRPKLMKI